MHSIYPPSHARKYSGWWLKLLVLIVVLIFLGAVWYFGNHLHKDQTYSVANTPKISHVSFNKSQYSVNDPASLWVVVNKGRILPSDYTPPNLVVPNVPLRLTASNPEMEVRTDTAQALETMFDAAKIQGLQLMLASGYRSYNEQVSVYSGFVSSSGQASADASSARPGHSEHQTGLAADIEPASRTCEIDQCFATTPEGKWLAINAYKFGFILRYPAGKEGLTGYEYEPWHVRYVGTALADQINKTGQTLEQFFGLPTYSDYPTTSYQLKGGL